MRKNTKIETKSLPNLNTHDPRFSKVAPAGACVKVLSAHLHEPYQPYVKQPLERLALHDVTNDTKSRAFCGPTAVAAITGAPSSLVRDCYRFARFGAKWINNARAPAIMGTNFCEIQSVLRMLGFTGLWHTIEGSPTFAAYMEGRKGNMRTHPCVVTVTGHFVAVSGSQFCDTFSKGKVIEADDAKGRRKRVSRVFVITGRVEPAADIPRKDYSYVRERQAETRKHKREFLQFVPSTPKA